MIILEPNKPVIQKVDIGSLLGNSEDTKLADTDKFDDVFKRIEKKHFPSTPQQDLLSLFGNADSVEPPKIDPGKNLIGEIKNMPVPDSINSHPIPYGYPGHSHGFSGHPSMHRQPVSGQNLIGTINTMISNPPQTQQNINPQQYGYPQG